MAKAIPFEEIAAHRQHPAMHPYFHQLARQKRVCPHCLSRPLRIDPSRTPNAVLERCSCGYIRVLTLPEGVAPLPNPQGDACRRARTQVPVERQAIEPYIPQDEWERMQAEISTCLQ